MDICVLFFLFFFNIGCVVSELSLRFVFIIESQEPELANQIGEAIKSAEGAGGVKISDAIVTLNRDDEEESYRMLCSSASPASLIIDLSWSPWEMATSLSERTGVPLIRSYLHDQQLMATFTQYLDSRNATDVALLIDGENAVDRTLYRLLGAGDVRLWAHAGLSRRAARSLRDMRPEPAFHAVTGDGGFVDETYRMAVNEKLVKRNYRWNLVINDYSEPNINLPYPVSAMIFTVDAAECCKLLQKDDCMCPSDVKRPQLTLTALVQYLADTYQRLGDISSTMTVDCDVEESSNATRDRLYKQFAEDSEGSNETLFYWNDRMLGIYLRTRYFLTSYTPGEGMQRLASWRDDEGYHLPAAVTLPPIRMFFRIGTAPAVPWTMHKLDPETNQPMVDEEGSPIYEGYCIDLIQTLSEVMPFDYEIVSPKTGLFGQKLPNGTWDGVVGDLMRGETDFAVAALTMTAEREEVIDFVAPYFEQTGILIVIRKPIRKTSLFKFMTVLRTEVWFSIVAALILTAFMIWLLDKYSPYSARNNRAAYPYPCRDFTLKESFWFALTSFTPQGGGEAPKALSGRTLVAAYWLFVVLMLATFTANLAAFLTVERMQTPVSSLEQLARQSRINYTVVEGSTTHQYFINMKYAEDTLYRVWKEITLNATSDQAQYRVWDYPIREQYGHILLAINASGPVPDAKTGFQQVDDHTEADFVFIHDSAEVKYEVTKNCNLTEVGEVFAEQPYALAVSQGSRIQELLSRALLDIQKDRVLEQLGAKYWNETARQLCPDADESEGITLESLGGVFIATLFGLGLAMITLAWEVFYYKRKEKNKAQITDATMEKPKEAFATSKKTIEAKMAEGMAKLRKRDKKGDQVQNITFGDSFKPVSEKSNVSYISVYPKTEFRN
uniref:Putative ionotropic receptor 9 n=1 Tax=Conopomorpha sinensis TaxID=940481 RepID=A0A3Q8HDA4_9NEOP|nr:putative ionotropic receptor 9 [Conopomorpha sinensis]